MRKRKGPHRCGLFFVHTGSALQTPPVDAEEDARFRPYRPVPRGLVTLRELGWIGALIAVVQFALARQIGWPWQRRRSTMLRVCSRMLEKRISLGPPIFITAI